MNKETIYIEPSDDITDILTKISSSEKKIIALVPPKKSGVLLSSINIKLLARAAKTEKKAIVLVTTDDSLIKLAMNANLPVAPSLKSRPVMPSEPAQNHVSLETPRAEDEPEGNESGTSDDPSETTADFVSGPESSKLIAPEDDAEETPSDEEDDAETAPVEEIEAEELEGDAESEKPRKKSSRDHSEKPDKPAKAKKSKPLPKNPVSAFLVLHKKLVIIGASAFVVLAAFLVWALKFAPRVNIAVSVRTTSGNFSENVTFTKDAAKEESASGIFAVTEEKLEKDQVVKFTATGQKDLGEPASGSLAVYFQDKDKFSFNLPVGTVFTYNGLEYVSTAAATIAWDGTSDDSCGTGSSISKGCLVSASVSVKASAPGENYNVSGQQSGWSSKAFPSLSVYNSTDLTGGTSKIVTVVQQSDVDLALSKLASESREEGKKELFSKLSDTSMPIEASFKIETTDPKSTPSVGEEVAEGVTPSVSSKTTYSILTVDTVRLEEFITTRANIDDSRRLYSVGSPFVEYFTEAEDGTFTGKLKTTYKSGPKISETEILEQIQGQKIGRVEPILKDKFSGVASVGIEKSYFWVSTVPTDPNKIKITLEVDE